MTIEEWCVELQTESKEVIQCKGIVLCSTFG